jgi:putative membrane protein
MKPMMATISFLSLCWFSDLAPAQQSTNADSDDRFVASAATSGTTELELCKLATQRAKHADVKSFVEDVLRDHAATNVELFALARRKRITIPKSISAKQRDQISKLSKIDRAKFDRAFALQFIEDEKAAVTLFRAESEHGADPELREFATKILPTLKNHLRLAQELSQGAATR